MEKCTLNDSLLLVKYNVSSLSDYRSLYYNGTILSKLGCDAYNPCTEDCLQNVYLSSFEDIWVSPYAHTIYGYIYPGLLLVTIIANVFILIVLTRPHMRNATNAVLLYMSIAQLLVALVPAPFLLFYYTLGFYQRKEEIQPSWCVMGNLLASDSLPPIINNAAIWLAVLLAFQRVICVWLPIKSRRISTIKNVNIATAFIILLSFLGNLLPFLVNSRVDVFKFEAVSSKNKSDVWREVSCLYYKSKFLRIMGEGNYTYYYIWPRAIIFAFVPIVLLLGLTLSLIVFLKRNRARRSRLLEHKEKKKDATSTMLVLIVIVFLVVNLPMGVLLILLALKISGATIQINPTAQSVAMMIDNLLILASYPINFAIYCSMSAQFRTTFKKLFVDAPSSYFKNHNGTAVEQVPLKQAGHQNSDDPSDCML